MTPKPPKTTAVPYVIAQAWRILLIEDEPFTRAVLVEGLRSQGVSNIAQAGEVDEAKQLMVGDDRRFDCVVSDFELPGKHGLQFLQMVRMGMTGARRSVPFIIVTSHADRHLVAPAIELDVSAFLGKPVDPVDFVGKLHRAITRGIVPKPVAEYALVPVGDLKPSVAKLFASGVASHLTFQPMTGHVLMSTKDLETGMIISRPVLDPRGEELMPAGTKLSQRLLDCLQDLARFESCYEQAWIKTDSSAPAA